eukprot:TRINITY_DN1038_c1_g1_i6.p1 TRINITY_DN1038_c1_g1~~TRINITY_DN1038_c1_g1_i6.p1  ORF type:complete len:374 (-),score=-29.76 TRINITY_DN1038_c1_g1_i6:724-1824(-)
MVCKNNFLNVFQKLIFFFISLKFFFYFFFFTKLDQLIITLDPTKILNILIEQNLCKIQIRQITPQIILQLVTFSIPTNTKLITNLHCFKYCYKLTQSILEVHKYTVLATPHFYTLQLKHTPNQTPITQFMNTDTLTQLYPQYQQQQTNWIKFLAQLSNNNLLHVYCITWKIQSGQLYILFGNKISANILEKQNKLLSIIHPSDYQMLRQNNTSYKQYQIIAKLQACRVRVIPTYSRQSQIFTNLDNKRTKMNNIIKQNQYSISKFVSKMPLLPNLGHKQISATIKTTCRRLEFQNKNTYSKLWTQIKQIAGTQGKKSQQNTIIKLQVTLSYALQTKVITPFQNLNNNFPSLKISTINNFYFQLILK